MNDLLLRAAQGERTERPPVWLMRQAGRHLPEYRALRSRYSFREAVTTPAVAEEITLQPWDRYRPDGLVIFSDILTAIEPLGFSYRIEPGEGPVIDNPVTAPADVPTDHTPVAQALDYVGDLIHRLTDRVGDEVPIIGFAGGPLTLAAYLVNGPPSRDNFPIRRFRVAHPDAFSSLLAAISEVVAEHLRYQIESGADIVQLFDTYAGILSPSAYREVLLPLHRQILTDLPAPSIVFARNMGGRLRMLREAGADVVGLDWTVDMATARAALGPHPVQGNLDPAVLFGSPSFIREQTEAVIDAAGATGHILNLGHGVHKDTPVAGVETFVETAKTIDR